jgi:hypothetical protein
MIFVRQPVAGVRGGHTAVEIPMTTPSQGASSGPAVDTQSEPEFKEYLVKRDKEGPLSFLGVQLAKATRQSSGLMQAMMMVETLEAALYKTRGGKFITSLSKTRHQNAFASMVGTNVEDEAGPDKSGYYKAGVHDTFESAMEWFRPGRLTDEIRRQLGLDQPVRIE